MSSINEQLTMSFGPSERQASFLSLGSWPLAQQDSRVFYQWMRIEQMDQWIHWFGLGCVLLLLISYIVFWYRRDWKELPKGVGWTLLLLRLLAIGGILFFFLDLQKRSEKEVVRASKLAVLVDTSLSMTMPQEDSINPTEIIDTSASRIAAVQNFFKESSLLQDFQQQHDVSVYRFDQSVRPSLVASFLKPQKTPEGQGDTRLDVWRTARSVALAGSVLGMVALVGFVFALASRVRGNQTSVMAYVMLASVLLLMASFVMVATAILRADSVPWTSLWAAAPPDLGSMPGLDSMEVEQSSSSGASSEQPNSTLDNPAGSDAEQAKPAAPKDVAWEVALAATGAESRIGDALHAVLEQESGSPLAGIVLVTDGRSNAGLDPVAIISEAAVQGIPVHTIGMGTSRNPVNVRVMDVEAPKRVFPGDRFRLNALIQATGMEGQQVAVQLRRRAGGQNTGSMAIEEERTITLGEDDAIQSLPFEIMPKEVGSWIYEIKVNPVAEDSNPQDDALEREVRVVEPNATVLVMAGGPTREYQFVRNLLYRDATMQSHVYLQTSGPGVSQESQKLLTEFPRTRADMSQYDCVIAFDADWMALDKEQLDVLERWVSDQAGGLVLVAGPVSTPRWAGGTGTGNPKAEILRNLSPLVLNSRGARLVSIGRFEGETAWPLQLASDAMQSDFMQVGKTPEESLKVWQDFKGVYSYYACYEPKPGATPIASFSDPTTSVNGTLPIYLATQFYGAGRVAFEGSGELWRLRDLGEHYFDTYYTKLVRWAGQGRLLRDSDRGMLLLDKEQAIVGEQVMVRAVLKDAQFQPLILPEVNARLVDPNGRSSTLRLAPIPDPSQPGVYLGQFFTKATGNYEVQLPVGGLSEQIVLSQQVVVRVPALEIQRPQRNDPLLSELATRTGGRYWIGLNGLLPGAETATVVGGADGSESLSGEQRIAGGLTSAIAPRDQVHFLPGSADRNFQQRLMGLLMAWIVGCLSLEWLIRRISKLA